MELIHTVEAMQGHAEAARCSGQRLALVPTMGALHAGHLALIDEALRRADHVTVSIFVNPTQFGPGEDYDAYPRTLEADLRALEDRGGVDAVFAPSVAAMYPDGPEAHRAWVEVEGLDAHLCGRYRPGHFRGVATVVAKLLLACRPHVAVFGRKDAQQFVILRRLVRDLGFGVEVVGAETVREADGLALSSRNAYLTEAERAQAGVLSQAVSAVAAAVEEGEQRSERLVEAMLTTLAQAPLARVQYAEVVDARTLQPVARIAPGQAVIAAVAVYFGATRLIDNCFATAPPAPPERPSER
ncbi:MAG: pantoate--beta-alanine ligase [Rhodothermales bacterium]|nr:pantoate--beta-alanine ligase [Rhodothermales bacterium]